MEEGVGGHSRARLSRRESRDVGQGSACRDQGWWWGQRAAGSGRVPVPVPKEVTSSAELGLWGQRYGPHYGGKDVSGRRRATGGS